MRRASKDGVYQRLLAAHERVCVLKPEGGPHSDGSESGLCKNVIWGCRETGEARGASLRDASADPAGKLHKSSVCLPAFVLVNPVRVLARLALWGIAAMVIGSGTP